MSAATEDCNHLRHRHRREVRSIAVNIGIDLHRKEDGLSRTATGGSAMKAAEGAALRRGNRLRAVNSVRRHKDREDRLRGTNFARKVKVKDGRLAKRASFIRRAEGLAANFSADRKEKMKEKMMRETKTSLSAASGRMRDGVFPT
ncbi:MAG: hypothetical protein AAB699_03485 [Patescibacteria group bacterium]